MIDDPHLSKTARTTVSQEGNILLVSAASAWEIATKVRLGRLPMAADLVRNFVPELIARRIDVLAVSAEHGIQAGLLEGAHQDPFDRMLIAQALAEEIPIVSNDKAFDGHGVARIW